MVFNCNTFQKFGFLLICIPIRCILVYIAFRYYKNNYVMATLSAFTFIIGVCFLLIYIFNWRKTGVEVCGKKIWWNYLRPMHGILYISFAILAIQSEYKQYAYSLLLADVIIGVVAGVYKTKTPRILFIP